jgi:DNA (cytosine-5)-methyltransferase 1
VSKLRVLELFGGIGACSKALERLGIDYEIADYVEIDKYAVKSFNAIHNTNFEPQDICEWDKDIEVDLIMHGSPCQDFSSSGLQKSGDKGSGTRSSLMWETVRIVEKLKPKYVIWENVKNLLSKKHRHNFDAYLQTMEQLGYKNYYQVLNAKDYGIPQNRERVFTVSIRDDSGIRKGAFLGTFYLEDYEANNFEFPPTQELKLKLKDMLEDEVDEKYYLSAERLAIVKKNLKLNYEDDYIIGSSQKNASVNYDGVCPTLTSAMGLGGGQTPMIPIKNATKKGYLEAYEGDGVDISSRMQYHRGNVQKESIQTITTSGGNDRGVVLKSKCKRLESLIEKTEFEEGKVLNMDLYNQTTNENISQCLTEPHHNSQRLFDGLRIRKLTPKECWRLMGFDDADFDKAAQVNSNTQSYKQAGNSIVVNVLEAILKNLLFDNK